MATVKKTISVTEKQDDRIKSQVLRGDFTNESDYIRQLLRKDQFEQETYQETRTAIECGLYSGQGDRSIEEVWAVAEAEARE